MLHYVTLLANAQLNSISLHNRIKLIAAKVHSQQVRCNLALRHRALQLHKHNVRVSVPPQDTNAILQVVRQAHLRLAATRQCANTSNRVLLVGRTTNCIASVGQLGENMGERVICI